jgi:hypothetical protein
MTARFLIRLRFARCLVLIGVRFCCFLIAICNAFTFLLFTSDLGQ